jgi:mRNA-degrading endonuclease RelE of RelBE toxin-antitoxin system
MTYRIALTSDFREDLRTLTAAELARIRQALPRYLEDQPDRESRIRRPLAPNPLDANWELRLGDRRVFYDIDEPTRLVRVLRAGRKSGTTLYLRGQSFELRYQ